MSEFREKLEQFMIGRNGTDQLSRVTIIIAVIFLLLSMFIRGNLFYWLALVLVIWAYFRIFSKNTYARGRENDKFLELTYKLRMLPERLKKRQEQGKYYRFFTCPNCHQKVRVPKGKGKIQITCPRCKTAFIKKS